MVKRLPATMWETWVPGPGEGNGYPLQYFASQNSMHRGAWWATVQRVAKSLIQLSMHTYMPYVKQKLKWKRPSL